MSYGKDEGANIGPVPRLQLSSAPPGTGVRGGGFEQGRTCRRTSGDFIMPRRDSELPEGTDHVVRGASADGGGGFVATANAAGGTDRLVSQMRDQAASLADQAAGRLRGFADDGKGRVTDLLEGVGEVIGDAARSVDERLGEDYGAYAHRAAGAVSDLAGRLKEKSVDDLVDDTRDFVRKSPVIALGIAAVAGFALIRVLKSGLEGGGARGGA
jgi:ElaB/YqjD/DUF883 family membrane-anchored ribosome-binding protein